MDQKKNQISHVSLYRIQQRIKKKKTYPVNLPSIMTPEEWFSKQKSQTNESLNKKIDFESIGEQTNQVDLNEKIEEIKEIDQLINAIEWIDLVNGNKKNDLTKNQEIEKMNIDFSKIHDASYVENWLSLFLENYVLKWLKMNGIDTEDSNIKIKYIPKNKIKCLFQMCENMFSLHEAKKNENLTTPKRISFIENHTIQIDSSLTSQKIKHTFDCLERSVYSCSKTHEYVFFLWIQIEDGNEEFKKTMDKFVDSVKKQNLFVIYVSTNDFEHSIQKTICNRWGIWKKSQMNMNKSKKFYFIEIIPNSSNFPDCKPIFNFEVIDKIWIDASYFSSLFVKFPCNLVYDSSNQMSFENISPGKKNIIKLVNRLSKKISTYNFSDIEKEYDKNQIGQCIKNEFPKSMKIMFAPEYNYKLIDLINKKGLFFCFCLKMQNQIVVIFF